MDSLSSALRGEAEKPGAFADWLAQAQQVRIHLGRGYVYPSLNPVNEAWREDAFEGLTAIRNALRRLSTQQGEQLLASLPFAAALRAVLQVGSRQYDRGPAPVLDIQFAAEGATANFRGQSYSSAHEQELIKELMKLEV